MNQEKEQRSITGQMTRKLDKKNRSGVTKKDKKQNTKTGQGNRTRKLDKKTRQENRESKT